MHQHREFRYLAEVTSRHEQPVEKLWLSVDWDPARQWSFFELVRSGELPPSTHLPPSSIEPVWDPRERAPVVNGFKVVFEGGDQDRYAIHVPAAYFREAVQTASASLVKSKRLEVGEQFAYRVCAFAGPSPAPARGGAEDFEIDAIDEQLELHTLPGELFLSTAERRGESVWNDHDLPVFIHARVLEEARALAESGGGLETGGVLIGRLCRDADAGDLCLEVTAQIPARHTVATGASLRFTPQSWVEADAAIALRNEGERLAGWHHCHPAQLWPCRHCPAQRRVKCPASRPFFSGDDCAVHRSVFPAAFNVALLLSFLDGDEPSIDLFGWREGRIYPRGFYLIPGNTGSVPARATTTGVAHD